MRADGLSKEVKNSGAGTAEVDRLLNLLKNEKYQNADQYWKLLRKTSVQWWMVFDLLRECKTSEHRLGILEVVKANKMGHPRWLSDLQKEIGGLEEPEWQKHLRDVSIQSCLSRMNDLEGLVNLGSSTYYKTSMGEEAKKGCEELLCIYEKWLSLSYVETCAVDEWKGLQMNNTINRLVKFCEMGATRDEWKKAWNKRAKEWIETKSGQIQKICKEQLEIHLNKGPIVDICFFTALEHIEQSELEEVIRTNPWKALEHFERVQKLIMTPDADDGAWRTFWSTKVFPSLAEWFNQNADDQKWDKLKESRAILSGMALGKVPSIQMKNRAAL
jgi:hypothetical protein